jgi:2',3'-cyclic-nucleotide 2'-phosphodiesterase (5'-nucleotidase family)
MHNPSGGLARRKTAVASERARGVPVLVLDAGNALFKSARKGDDPKERERAGLLLEQMDALGTAAMAVGARDLTLGTDFLLERTKKAKLKLLSANLVDGQGKLLFPASTVVTAGGVRFGVIGLSPVGGLVGAVGRPAIPAATAEARRLRQKEKVDVVVVLAAIPYTEALQLAQQAEGVDFVMQSGDGRGVGMAQRNGFATLVPVGERGRQLGKLELSLGGAGPFVDQSEHSRAQERLKALEAQVERTKQRLAATQDATAKQALQEALGSHEAQRAAVKQSLSKAATGSGRTHLLSYIHLGGDIASDPALQKVVERLEPPGPAAH